MAKPMKRSTRNHAPGQQSFEEAHPITAEEREQNKADSQAEEQPDATPARRSQQLPNDLSPNDPDTLKWILEEQHGIRLRLNERLDRYEYSERSEEGEDGPWQINNGSWRNKIRMLLWRNWHYLKAKPQGKKGETIEQPWNISREKAVDWCELISTDQRDDDVELFFRQLSGQWDRQHRIEQTLQDHLGAENNPLTQWASVFQFVGCILATLDPGKQRRGIITLIGKQFGGKTTWILKLLPEHLAEYAATISLAGEDEKRTAKIVGMAVVELGELAGASKADNDALKSWLTRVRDYVRLPYRRDPEQYLRKCLMMASINENQKFPEDSGGTTRFVGIPCPQECNVEAIPEKTRLQWWAEAMAIVDGNHPTLSLQQFDKGIPRDLLKAQAEANQPFERRDETIENMLTEAEFEIGHQAKAIDIAKQIGFLPMHYADGTTVTTFASQREQREFTAELEKNGWAQKRYREQGKVVKGWTFEGK